MLRSYNTEHKTNRNTQSIETKRIHRNLLSAFSNTTNPLGVDKSRWMQSLHENGLMTEDVVLNDLVLPGSHDSAAFHMDNKACLELLSKMPDITKSHPSWRKQIPRKTAQNQNIGILDQLRNGIRFLDLRIIAHSNYEGIKYPLHHTFIVDDSINSLFSAIQVISDFLTENSMESIVVRLYSERACMEDGLDYRSEWEDFMSTFGDRFITLSRDHLNTSMMNLRGKALVDYRFWNDSIESEHWPGEGFGLETINNRYCGDPFKYGPYYASKQGESNR